MTMLNDRDQLLQAAPVRNINPTLGKLLLLVADPQIFHVTAAGAGSPSSITLVARPLNIPGVVTWSITAGGVLTGSADNVRTLALTNMTADSVIVTAQITYEGQTYGATQTITKVRDGAAGEPGEPGVGTPGAAGNSAAVAYVFQWSTVEPAKPTGTATVTWSSASVTSYVGTDSWSMLAPANPGTPLIKLWVASKSVTAPAGTITSSVTFSSGASVAAYSQNGGTGPAGAAGIKNATALAYQWGVTAPTASGSATHTWATGAYDTPPETGWTATKPAAPGSGYTLYEASVRLVDSSGAATSAINWATASIAGIAYIGASGGAGSQGASAKVCYCLIAGTTLALTPATSTRPGTALPATGTWGETNAWQATSPNPAAGQSVFVCDGIFDPVPNQTVWNVPYLAQMKVGSLSAISANLGAVTAGSVTLGAGKLILSNDGSAMLRKLTIIDDVTDETILATGVPLNPDYAAPGTKNSDVPRGGPNLIPTNSLPTSVVGYTAAADSGVSLSGPTYAGPGHTNDMYSPGRAGSVYVVAGGIPAVDSRVEIYRSDEGGMVPVVAGRRYEFSAALSTHRCKSQVCAAWYNAASQLISEHTGNFVVNSVADYSFADFPRSLLFATAPAGAVLAMIFVRQQHNGTGSNPATLASQWYVGAARATQTEPSTYVQAVAEAAATNSALQGKLNKNSDDILGGILSVNVVSAPAGFRAGNLTWNAAGDRTGGYGVAMTPKGLVGYSSAGVATFSINAATGKAIFADELQAAYGTFGAVSIAAGGHIRSGMTGYAVGTGWWMGLDAGVAKFSIGNATQYFRWDGATLLLSCALSGATGTFSGDLSSARVSVGPAGSATTFFEPGYSAISLNSSAVGVFWTTATANSASVFTSDQLKFRHNDTTWPIERRIRSGNVFFSMICTAVVDDQLSIWCRLNGGAWTWLSGTQDPQAGLGTCATGYGLAISVPENGTVEFGMSATNQNMTAYSMNLLSLSSCHATVIARNF